MAESDRRLSLEISWSTLLKIIAAVALVSVLTRIWYILTLVLIAIIVAVGLEPAVAWLERRPWPRWVAASTVVIALFVTIVGFFTITWNSISGQAQDLGGNWLAANDLNFSERYLAAVKRVTPVDLQRVAREYLTAENRTLYALLPTGAAPSEQDEAVLPCLRTTAAFNSDAVQECLSLRPW